MDSNEREELRKKGERVRDGKYRSRAHSKTEKRKQRKAWKKRKLEAGGEKNETTRGPEIQEVPEPQRVEQLAKNPSPVANTLSRGKYLVKLSKRKRQTEEKNVPAAKIPRKRMDVGVARETRTVSTVKRTDRPTFKEIDRALLTVDKTQKIGSGTFGNCYLAVYRNDFRVVAKEIKKVDSPAHEVLREAAAITGIGDHWGIPHLFGVCTKQAPHYLVLQFHALHSESVTLLKAASEGVIKHVAKCAEILKQTCEVLMHIHARGFLHNDLKGNNVVIDGAENKPVIIDFGKSCKIIKARLQKPKLDVDKAIATFPHIAPEIHRGQKQSIASDVFSFGVLITGLFKKAKLEIPPALKEIAKKCQRSNPGKRPKLAELFAILSELS